MSEQAVQIVGYVFVGGCFLMAAFWAVYGRLHSRRTA
jgi:hypothetical protein